MSEWTVKTAIEALNMTSQHETPTTWANRVVFALEALAREQTSAARLLGYIEDAKQTAETWRARAVRAEDLAREKADATPTPAQAAERLGRELVERYGPDEAPQAPVSGSHYQALSSRVHVAERDLSSAICRAEAAEKELEHKRNGMTDLSNRLELMGGELRAAEKERDRAKVSLTAEQSRREEAARLMREANRDCGALEADRDALRAACEGLSKQHEQDKAELVRRRKAAAELRSTFPKCRHDETPSDVLVVHRILDAAEKP